MTKLADIGAVLRMIPGGSLYVRESDDLSYHIHDLTPFYFRVHGHIYDGQLFYGLFGPVVGGPSRYAGLICNMTVRVDAADWRVQSKNCVNFKVGPNVVTRNHRESFYHPEGTRLEGYPRFSEIGLVEVVDPATLVEVDGT